jgi:D-xylose transport system substrate-binding protein
VKRLRRGIVPAELQGGGAEFGQQPYKAMADAAAQLMVAAIKKEKPPEGLINGTWDNKFTPGGVPAHLEPNVFVSPDNVQQTVIDAGLFKKEEVCQGIAAASVFCKGG